MNTLISQEFNDKIVPLIPKQTNSKEFRLTYTLMNKVFEQFNKIKSHYPLEEFLTESINYFTNQSPFFIFVCYYLLEAEEKEILSKIKISQDVISKILKDSKRIPIVVDEEIQEDTDKIKLGSENKTTLTKSQKIYIDLQKKLAIAYKGEVIFFEKIIPEHVIEETNEIKSHQFKNSELLDIMLCQCQDKRTLKILDLYPEKINDFLTYLHRGKVYNKSIDFYKKLINNPNFSKDRLFIDKNKYSNDYTLVQLKTWDILLYNCPYPILEFLEDFEKLSGADFKKEPADYITFLRITFDYSRDRELKRNKRNFVALFNYLLEKPQPFLQEIFEGLLNKSLKHFIDTKILLDFLLPVAQKFNQKCPNFLSQLKISIKQKIIENKDGKFEDFKNEFPTLLKKINLIEKEVLKPVNDKENKLRIL